MSETQETQKPAPKEPVFTILGTMGFDSLDQLDKFVANMDIQGSIFTLIQAANYAQSKGCFSLAEASLIAKAIRNVVRKAEPEETANQGS